MWNGGRVSGSGTGILGWDGEQGCFKETPLAVGELDCMQACWLPVKTQACRLKKLKLRPTA